MSFFTPDQRRYRLTMFIVMLVVSPGLSLVPLGRLNTAKLLPINNRSGNISSQNGYATPTIETQRQERKQIPLRRLQCETFLSSGMDKIVDFVFQKHDFNSDGVLSFDEFYKLVLLVFIRVNRYHTIRPPSESESKVLFQRFDKDNSGSLCNEECKKACLELLHNVQIPRPAIFFRRRLLAFLVGKGITDEVDDLLEQKRLMKEGMEISFDEFYKAVLELYIKVNRHTPLLPPSESQMRILFHHADKDHNGKLSVEECDELSRIGLSRLIGRVVTRKLVNLMLAPYIALKTVQHCSTCMPCWAVSIRLGLTQCWWIPQKLESFALNEKAWIVWVAMCYSSFFGCIFVRLVTLIYDEILRLSNKYM